MNLRISPPQRVTGSPMASKCSSSQPTTFTGSSWSVRVVKPRKSASRIAAATVLPSPRRILPFENAGARLRAEIGRERFLQCPRQAEFADGKSERGKHFVQNSHVVVAEAGRRVGRERNGDAFQRRSRREPDQMQDIIGAAFRAQVAAARESVACGIRDQLQDAIGRKSGHRPAARKADCVRRHQSPSISCAA